MLIITDTLNDRTPFARKYVFWENQGFKKIYKEFASNGKLPESFKKKITDVREVQNVFKLKGFQFGNWVTNEDRYNYLAALGISLYHMNKVLKFKGDNLGLDCNLGVAFGARGVKGAAAHYESMFRNKQGELQESHIINMTRYWDADRFQNPEAATKELRFVGTGGAGSFAHEYGHFLDFLFGYRIEVEKSIAWLSDGRSVSFRRIQYDKKKFPLRYLMEDILEEAYWNETRDKPSAYLLRVQKNGQKEYWWRRNEIFARCFEQYIGYKLKKLKIVNRFLTSMKYEPYVYMNAKELERMVPKIDALISAMRKYVSE